MSDRLEAVLRIGRINDPHTIFRYNAAQRVVHNPVSYPYCVAEQAFIWPCRHLRYADVFAKMQHAVRLDADDWLRRQATASLLDGDDTAGLLRLLDLRHLCDREAPVSG